MRKKPTRDLEAIVLLPPLFRRAGSLSKALNTRRTSRSISDRPIPLQILSDLLWAAQGVNRPKGPFGGPGRTAGSASNSQEICVYAALGEGTFLYQPAFHRLIPIRAEDIRVLAIGAGQGKAGANAPLRLIYVVDLEKFESAGFKEPGLYDSEVQKSYYFVDTGLIAENVYLAAASLGLVSWFHNCNRAELSAKLGLKPGQKPLFGHTVGYALD
jgi:nitroreductase